MPRSLAALMALTALLLAPLPAAIAAETGDLDRLRERALSLVNQARDEAGLQPLEAGAALNEAALAHARDMLQRNFYSHVSPDGETARERYLAAGGGRWRLVAENIAHCRGCGMPPTVETVDTLHDLWMESPGHRENILRRGLDRFGFGLVGTPEDGVYAVQTFAGAGTPPGADPGEDLSEIDPAAATEVALARIGRARSQAGLDPIERSPALETAADRLLPGDPGATFTLPNDPAALADALPTGTEGDWSQLAVIAASCGGCGATPTAADVRRMVDQWLDGPDHRGRLLDSAFDHLGFTIRADGEGRKIALAVLGAKR